MSRDQKRLLEEARRMGIETPEKLTKEELTRTLQICEEINRYSEQLKQLGVKLPKQKHKFPVSSKPTAEHNLREIKEFFWKTLTTQLKRVKDNSPVTFEGEDYTVSVVIKEPRYKDYVEWYVLVPAEGGKPIRVDWFKLAIDLKKQK